MNTNQIDYESKQTFTNFLTQRGFTNITETGEYDNWDIEADWKGTTYYFELKKRTFPSTKYGDTIIDEVKVQPLCQKLADKLNRVYITNIFTDHKLTVIPFVSTYTTFQRYASETTYFDNKNKVKKTFYSWKNTNKNIYDYAG